MPAKSTVALDKDSMNWKLTTLMDMLPNVLSADTCVVGLTEYGSRQKAVSLSLI